MKAETTTLQDEPFAVDLTESEVVYHGRIWDIVADDFLYDGKPIRREYVRHTGAVAILALNDHDEIALINQYRRPPRSKMWEVPAGLLDVPGEAPLEAAKRELAEEADLQAKHWRPFFTFTTTPGGSSEVLHLFIATELSPTPTSFARFDEEADIRLSWFPLEQVVDAILGDKVSNPSLITGVLGLWAERTRRES